MVEEVSGILPDAGKVLTPVKWKFWTDLKEKPDQRFTCCFTHTQPCPFHVIGYDMWHQKPSRHSHPQVREQQIRLQLSALTASHAGAGLDESRACDDRAVCGAADIAGGRPGEQQRNPKVWGKRLPVSSSSLDPDALEDVFHLLEGVYIVIDLSFILRGCIKRVEMVTWGTVNFVSAVFRLLKMMCTQKLQNQELRNLDFIFKNNLHDFFLIKNKKKNDLSRKTNQNENSIVNGIPILII